MEEAEEGDGEDLGEGVAFEDEGDAAFGQVGGDAVGTLGGEGLGEEDGGGVFDELDERAGVGDVVGVDALEAAADFGDEHGVGDGVDVHHGAVELAAGADFDELGDEVAAAKH